jgi:hypothetical protein
VAAQRLFPPFDVPLLIQIPLIQIPLIQIPLILIPLILIPLIVPVCHSFP